MRSVAAWAKASSSAAQATEHLALHPQGLGAVHRAQRRVGQAGLDAGQRVVVALAVRQDLGRMHLGVQRQGLGAGAGAGTGRIAGGVQRLHRGQQVGLVAPVAQDLPALAQDAHPLRQRGLVVQRRLPVGLGVGVGIQRQRRFGRGQAVGHGAGRLAAGFPVACDVGAVLAGRLQHPAYRLGLALHPGDHSVAHAVGHRQFGIVLRGIVERRLPGAIRPQAQQARAAPLAQRLAQEERVAAGGAFQPLGEAARVAGARQPIDQCRDAVAIQRRQAQHAGAGGLLQRLLPGCGLGRRPFGPLHPDLTDRPGCAAGLRGGRRGHRRAGHAQAGADACGQLLGLGAGCQAQLAHQGVAAAHVLGQCGAAVARGGVQAHGLRCNCSCSGSSASSCCTVSSARGRLPAASAAAASAASSWRRRPARRWR